MAAFVAVTAGLLIVAGAARADGVINTTFIGTTAIEGHDPVAYFTEGKPVEGSSAHTYQWKGATWKFSTKENRDSFAASPRKFAPRYGGYCAWAVAQGYTAGIDPEAWRVVDGKLYLNNSKSIQKRWAQDIPGNIAKGDANWPKIAAKLAE
ncbi:MAG: YHS domain-containing (seleno)protein [Rhodospirillales bacterium]|nr:YHS domain-containing (seleno)protein [Rhodospirillales bacterium]